MKKRIITLSLFGALALGALPTHAATLPLMDSSQMNLTAINAVRGETVVSVGLIMAWGAGNSPQDPEKWFECDGRTFSAAVYPDLAMIYPTLRVPDYRDQFLRGGASSQVGQTASDTTRSHYHSQPTHTHTVNTMLSSTALSGTAAAQTVKDNHTGFGKGASGGFGVMNGYTASAAGDPSHSHVMTPNEIAWSYIDSQTHTTEGPSAVSGQLLSGTASGSAAAGGGNNTYVNSNSDGSTGGAETAPQHTRTRYLIRALP